MIISEAPQRQGERKLYLRKRDQEKTVSFMISLGLFRWHEINDKMVKSDFSEPQALIYSIPNILPWKMIVGIDDHLKKTANIEIFINLANKRVDYLISLGLE